MQSLDREIQSLIFPGNNATDQNKFDNCEEYEHLNQTGAKTSLIRHVPIELQMLMSAHLKYFETQNLSNQASDHPGS